MTADYQASTTGARVAAPGTNEPSVSSIAHPRPDPSRCTHVPIEGDLGVGSVIRALVVGAVLIVAGGSLLGVVAARARQGRTGFASPVLGVVVVASVLVVAVVGARQLEASATGWDLVWAVAAGTAGVLAARRLLARPQP